MTAHDFGPWLDLPELEDPERRCRRCGAKEWKRTETFVYGNALSVLGCGERPARPAVKR